MGATASRTHALKSFDDGVTTESSRVQRDTEDECNKYYLPLEGMGEDLQNSLAESGFLNVTVDPAQPLLLRKPTVDFLKKGLSHALGPSYVSLDASRPWLVS